MIDVEAEVYARVSEAVKDRFPNAATLSEYVRAPSAFPCVSVVQADSSMYERTRDSGSLENHATVMFEVNCYSNKLAGKKSECKALAAIVDAAFERMGFTRLSLNPFPNLEDATIYRVAGRYRGIVSKDKTIFGR